MRSLLAAISMVLVSSLVACAAPSVGSLSESNTKTAKHKTSHSDDADDDDDSAADEGNDTTPTGKGSSSSAQTATKQTLTVASTGDGTGDVASDPPGVTCTAGAGCKGDFTSGTKVTLTATAKDGSIFAGWTGGGCTGTTTCQTTVAAAATVTAQWITLAGSWSGTFEHSQQSGGCTFTNKGTLESTMAGTTGAYTTAATATGFELRQVGNGTCNLVSSNNPGTAKASAATVSGNTVTGTWSFSIPNASGTLPLPFTATIVGTKMTGKWTCTGCTGSFDVSKQ